MRRREFIAGLGAAAWPLAARAQQKGPMRRIGVLVSTLAADNPAWQARNTAFVHGLQQFGWTAGRNVEIDYRWGLGDDERRRKSALELVALMPDVLLAAGNPALPALQQATAHYRSCLPMSSTRSATAFSQAWRAPAATPPAS
jgi:putative tryptophan/tyrosine transport system substrate-binding protein